MTKPIKLSVCPAKTQISLRIHQSDQSSQCILWIAKDPSPSGGEQRLIRLGECPGVGRMSFDFILFHGQVHMSHIMRKPVYAICEQ